MAIEARDAWVQLRALSFHYRDWGGEGTPLVLLHGLASNARFWDLAAPHLVESFRVLALDQRGHGGSAKPDEGYDFSTVGGDVAAFLQALALQRPLLVGHSWGGNVAVQVGADQPGLARGLVCIDGGYIEPAAAPGATWEATERALAPPDFAALRLPWEEMLERSRGWATSQAWGDRRVDFLRANFDVIEDGTVRPRLTRERHMRIVRALWDQRVSSLYPGVACPVLLMPARQRGAGARDSAGSGEEKEAAVERALGLLPRGRVVWMEDSIHDVPVQRPAEVAKVIVEAARGGFFDA